MKIISNKLWKLKTYGSRNASSKIIMLFTAFSKTHWQMNMKYTQSEKI